MGASAKEEQLEIIESRLKFSKRVGMIDFARDVEPLGFKLSSVSAIFGEKELKALIRFCDENPDYHIVSYVGPYIYRNKYIPRCFPYFLAHGDANQNLLCHPYHNGSYELYHEDIQQKLAAKITEIYRSNNGKPIF